MRCHWIAAGFVICLLAADVQDKGYTYPAIEKGDTSGVLTVTIPEDDASKPSRAEYRLEISTGTQTEVKAPELVNAGSWKSTSSAPEIALLDDKHKTVRFYLQLEQTKGGSEPLPGVTVPFRKDANADWDSLTWNDVLKELRDLQPPVDSLSSPSRSGWSLWWIVGITAVLIAVLAVGLRAFWPQKPPPPLTPTERALRDLDRIEGLGLAGPDETGWYPAEISSVMRRYLSERYGLPAQQQTTAEFLDTMRQTPELTLKTQQTMKELLELCDLAKFAAQRTPSAECRRIAALARTVVLGAAPSDSAPSGI